MQNLKTVPISTKNEPEKPIIRRVREALGLTQSAFAKAVGRSYAAIRSYESGRKPPAEVMGSAMALCAKAGLIELAHDVESAAYADIGSEGERIPVDRARLHSALDRILLSGDADTAKSVVRLLEVALYFITSGRSGTISKSGEVTYR
jgi:DNA-binding transcriptional regulator YiaG